MRKTGLLLFVLLSSLLVSASNFAVVDTIVPFKKIMAPSGFSPNGDGWNDEVEFSMNSWGRSATGEMMEVEVTNIEIYSMDDSLVFSAESVSVLWDGKCEGVDCPVGTYYWLVQYVDLYGITRKEKGIVVLIR